MLFNDIVCKNILILKKQQVNEQRNASVDNFLRIIFVYNPGGSNFMPSN
jgi:DNA polymerase-3 subunit alpha